MHLKQNGSINYEYYWIILVTFMCNQGSQMFHLVKVRLVSDAFLYCWVA